MTTLAQGACAFDWRNYLLRHSSISEDDDRRSALYRYITDLRERRSVRVSRIIWPAVPIRICEPAQLFGWDKISTHFLKETKVSFAISLGG
jgi:hypothetical protein